MKKVRFFLLLTIHFFYTALCFSQEKNFRNEFGFRSDNDAYLGTAQDHYYTNGLFITFRHALNTKSTVWNKKIIEAEAGQYMYNSYSGDTEKLEQVDRPFAAYLYGGMKLNWFTSKESHLQAAIQIGTIGPNAYGREVQETLHKAVGFYAIHGWEYQVKNETGFNSSFNYSKLLTRNNKTDLILSSYANVGNTFTVAGIGLLFRTGKVNPIFSSSIFNSRISAGAKDTIARRESFFYARPVLNIVAYNATIQGGMFQSDKGPITFEPNRFLFTQELGYMYSKNRWTFNFSITLQTKELKSQLEAQQYGSASIYYRFR